MTEHNQKINKIALGPQVLHYPMPLALIGAQVDGKPNYLAVAWFTMVNYKPLLAMVALGKMHYTNKGIKENNSFSINIPSSSMAEKADYCGLVSGSKVDKSELFHNYYGKLKDAPLIEECPLSVECRLVKTVELEADELFIGEIVETYCEERYLTNGRPDIVKIQPMILSMGPEQMHIGN